MELGSSLHPYCVWMFDFLDFWKIGSRWSIKLWLFRCNLDLLGECNEKFTMFWYNLNILKLERVELRIQLVHFVTLWRSGPHTLLYSYLTPILGNVYNIFYVLVLHLLYVSFRCGSTCWKTVPCWWSGWGAATIAIAVYRYFFEL